MINRTPSKVLDHLSPFKVLYHVKPDYSILRSFGCLVFASTLQAARTKFEAHATACVFLGYPIGVKGYKLLDLETKRVFLSRDVIFPYQHTAFKDQIDPFAQHVIPIVL